jgi:hypothetical protein
MYARFHYSVKNYEWIARGGDVQRAQQQQQQQSCYVK